VLRIARTKKDGRAGIEAFARTEFERYSGLARKDFNRIEHLLRRGKRQIDTLKQADVAGVQVVRPPPLPQK
jgi:succinate dehydrogenase assembly factor 1